MWRIRTSSGAVHNLFLLITVCCWFAHILLATPDAPFAADKIFVFIWLFTSKNIVINDKIRATFSQEHFKNIASKEQIITKGKATYFNKSLLAETVGFEPTVPVKVQLISSQSRYDHFDTSPYMLTRIREVNALFNFIRIFIRTQRVSKLLICREPALLKAWWSFDFSKQRNISSQSRYDHFDTAPYLSQHQHLGKRGELMGRTSKNIKLRIPEKPRKIKGFRTGSYRVASTISSQARYDHFDTLPYKNTQPNCIQLTRTILYQILDRFSSITFTGFCIHL